MTALEREPLSVARETYPEPLVVPRGYVITDYASWQRHVKRVMDLTIVALLAPLVLSLCLLIALAIKASSPGPALFRHERVGQFGRPFRMLKFRTMYADAAERLHADPVLYRKYVAHDFKLPAEDDPRITPLGRLLRRLSLDELPQLWNVLTGDMSLVGPRPVEAAQVPSYGSAVAVYLAMRPGLTGRWQTTGRSTVRFPERADLDVGYLEHWSLWGDVVILLKTIPCVLRRHGSH